MKTNVLITGATGYIGSNLVKKLVNDGGVHITAIYNNTVPNEKNRDITWVKYTGDYESLNVIEGEIDVIFHLATFFTPKHSTDAIGNMITSNILLGAHLLEFAKQNKINKFINTSTYAQSIDDSKYNPQNFYTSTKQAFEDILKYYTESGVIKNITLSLYDTYGPNDNRPKFINLVIDALDKDVPFNMSPGNQEIRYVYIDDVVNAYCIALDLLMENKIDKSETFSISGNESMTLNELVEYVSNTVGKKIETNPGFYNYRDREIMKCIPKFNKIPNWEAKVKLSEGIKQIIQNNENRRN